MLFCFLCLQSFSNPSFPHALPFLSLSTVSECACIFCFNAVYRVQAVENFWAVDHQKKAYQNINIYEDPHQNIEQELNMIMKADIAKYQLLHLLVVLCSVCLCMCPLLRLLFGCADCAHCVCVCVFSVVSLEKCVLLIGCM